jgi:catechol 2,3-dioxygenase-like lactoylglutathione lyase family enzyme
MSSTQMRNEPAPNIAALPRIDMKLEVIVIPVSDVERAVRFYTALGWRQDADFVINSEVRLVQFTPPGSPCSIHFGNGISALPPGSANGLYLVVSDLEAARAELLRRDIEVSEIYHRDGPGKPAIAGPHPEHRSYFSYASFSDPDGNTWLLQEVTERFPGRVNADETKFTSLGDLAAALRRAEAAHTEHEKRTGTRDADWPGWYAEYLINEQIGKPLSS